MSQPFVDRLLHAVGRSGSPICVGIDPIFELLPPALRQGRAAEDADAALDALFDFSLDILRLVAGQVPIVKFQSAYFEKYHWEGVKAYYSLMQEAHDLGLLVIGDVKRGDIGSTAEAYAAGHLAEPGVDELEDVATPDAVTVNPMLGLDTLQPFVRVAQEQDKGLFVLVRTSNPGSAELQDVQLADGRTWSEALADALRPLAETLRSGSGYSALGAVVGATQAHTMQSLRQRLPHSIFLLPGYGTQGATAEMTRAAFQNGRGALVSASRSILYAHREKRYAERFGDDWKQCVAEAVREMKGDVAGVVGQ